MSCEWERVDTTTHQDHVIAHVVGAKVLAYFIFDETLHLLLDIGFIWTIYVDGQMVLLPHPVAVGELEIDESTKAKVKNDIARILSDGGPRDELECLVYPPAECVIKEVGLCASGDQRLIVLTGEDASLTIETSMVSGEIKVARI